MSHQSQSAISLPTTPQEQCLQNSDLLPQILLQFITSVAGRQSGPQTRSVPWHNVPWSIHDSRNALHSAALTSRAFYHSAIPLLWRRIDNLFPLLSLLPSFTVYHPEWRGGIRNRYLGQSAGDFYYLPGIIDDADWAVFDRHANYVKEIVHRTQAISPTVYTRLAMHKSILLPNLSLLEYGEITMENHTADLILYVSPSLVSVSLPASAPATETFLNMLSSNPPPLSHFHIGKHPSWVLSLCSVYRNLQSVSFTRLTGPVAHAHFLALASLPLLHSLTTDIYGWHKVDFHSIPLGSIFCALTYLKIGSALQDDLARILPLLIPRIGAISLMSIAVICEGRAENFAALSGAIAARWSTTIRNLEFTGIPCIAYEFSVFLGLPHIHTFELKRTLTGPLNNARVLAVLKCLAQHCPALRFLHLDFFPDPLPDLWTTPVLSHALAELEFSGLGATHASWRLVNMHLIAGHLDRLFPQLSRDHRWREVFAMMQERRRAA
ncbi:hypothetical protein B0H13DRAFT_2043552 [Mycena leptocephala]|nr:hypothetical protein B0H13DRAFT_2043552 [Mycena leptocephala]